MLKIAICDDEPAMRQAMAAVTGAALRPDTEICPYGTAEELERGIVEKGECYDILLLDIDMPGMGGFALAQLLRERGEETLIIFVSAHTHLVFASIQFFPFRFVRKGNLEQELGEALKAAVSRLEAEDSGYFVVRSGAEEVRVNYAHLLYFEKDGRYVRYYLKSGEEVAARGTLKEALRHFASKPQFIQINSGCYVHAKYIHRAARQEVALDNGKRLPVSRSRADAVNRALSRYWGDML